MATEAQVDCEELLIYSYGCLTKRREGALKLQNGVAEVLKVSWADKISKQLAPVTDWTWRAFWPRA